MGSARRGGWKSFDVPVPPGTARPQLTCSFCGKTEDEVAHLVRAGTKAIAICDECVRLCVEIFEESR